jgi:hypothetical protein
MPKGNNMNKFSIFNSQFSNNASIPNLEIFKFGHWNLFRNSKLEIRNSNRIALAVLFSILFSIFCFLPSAPTAHASALVKAQNSLGLVGYWNFEMARGVQCPMQQVITIMAR